MRQRLSSYWVIAFVMVVAKLIIHLSIATAYELHRDEMLYFAQGDHLSFGYISTPPFVGFLAFLSKTFFGYSAFGLKVFPALAGAASLLLIALMIKELGGKKFALIIAGIGYLAAGSFLRSNSLFQPVSFDQLFWLWSAYLFLKMVNTNHPKLWGWIGLVFGIAFLNKYAIVFFAFALIVSLLFTEHRKLLFSKYLIWGAAIGLAVILPNLWWQHAHNWPVVGHMVELQRTQLVNVSTGNFLLDQILMSASANFIWISGLIMVLFLQSEKKYRFIGISFLLVLAVILLAKGKSYYTLGAYPMLLAAGGYTMEKYFTRKLVYLNYFAMVFAVLLAIYFYPLALPVASFEVVERLCDPEKGIAQRWEDGKIHPIPQDYADMTGWKELTALVANAYNQLDDTEKERCTIYAENYGLAGAINFYGREYGLPKPISFHDSYLLWAPDSLPVGPLIYVNDEIGDIEYLFDKYEEIGRVNDIYFRENGVMVFLCKDAKPIASSFYKEKVASLKSAYLK